MILGEEEKEETKCDSQSLTVNKQFQMCSPDKSGENHLHAAECSTLFHSCFLFKHDFKSFVHFENQTGFSLWIPFT